ncbi:MAG: hypothetical protein PWP24_262 [Clostridiales bacterium]|nr:hypothetical protein [Clostridiales bacterium]
MQITYIGHSGFLVEGDSFDLIFDYYRGTLPPLRMDVPKWVFVSHHHEDHFNPAIFDWKATYPLLEYVISSDVALRSKENLAEDIHMVKGRESYLFHQSGSEIEVKTLKSTDCGVAFLIACNGRTIYHAGDLNLWIWEGETKQYNNDMKARFDREMEILKGQKIDVAFVPLDPRQGKDYDKGIEALINTAKLENVFPMHFWNKKGTVARFIKEQGSEFQKQGIFVAEVSQEGQHWEV